MASRVKNFEERLELDFFKELKKLINDPQSLQKALWARFNSDEASSQSNLGQVQQQFVSELNQITVAGEIVDTNSLAWIRSNLDRINGFHGNIKWNLQNTLNKIIIDSFAFAVQQEISRKYRNELGKQNPLDGKQRGEEEEETLLTNFTKLNVALNNTHIRSLSYVFSDASLGELENDSFSFSEAFREMIDSEIKIRKPFLLRNKTELIIISLFGIVGATLGIILTLSGVFTPFGVTLLGVLSMGGIGMCSGLAIPVPAIGKIAYSEYSLHQKRKFIEARKKADILSDAEFVHIASP
jgi:hypothetical protein